MLEFAADRPHLPLSLNVVDDDGIIFGRGRNSRRLYEITVDMNKVADVVKLTVDNLAQFIVKEIEEFSAKDKNFDRHSNYRLVEQAINDAKEYLLADATPPDTVLGEPQNKQ